jgi:hypothetical protein
MGSNVIEQMKSSGIASSIFKAEGCNHDVVPRPIVKRPTRSLEAA